MGVTKRLLEEEWERGYPLTGESVCSECFEDETIREFIGEHLSEHECSFCQSSRDDVPIACRLDDVIEHMMTCIRDLYSDADAECVPYDSEDEKYIVETRDTWDLLNDELDTFPMGSKRLTDCLLDAIPDRQWCKKSPELLSREEGLRLGWREFCHAIKHDTRYLFFRRGEGDEPEYVEPADMLSEIGDLVRNFRLVVDLPTGTRFLRARCTHEEIEFKTPAAVGPPPSKLSSTSRMSAAGITMFYGAGDESTAIAETRRDTDIRVSVGTFETLVPLRLLNLINLPGVPSLFSGRRHLREEVKFLWNFRRDAVSPVDPLIADYEYAPTQVVAEYFRRGCEYAEGKHLDGILYPSSKVHNGYNYVFFADRRNIDAVADDILSVSGMKKFRMTSVEHRHLPEV
jgi:hypothetical protein